MVFPSFNKPEWTYNWDATDYLGLNVDLLNDLLNSVLYNLTLCILFIPNQLTAVEQPIEPISQLIGDGKPLVKGQPISLTQMFFQTPC